MNENPDNPCPTLVDANDGLHCFIDPPIAVKLGDGSPEDAKKICKICQALKLMEKRIEQEFSNELRKKTTVYVKEFISLLDTLPEDSEGIKKWECPIPIKLSGIWGNTIFFYNTAENKKLHGEGACEYLKQFSIQFIPRRAQLGG
jgi:hypothetical protein